MAVFEVPFSPSEPTLAYLARYPVFAAEDIVSESRAIGFVDTCLHCFEFADNEKHKHQRVIEGH